MLPSFSLTLEYPKEKYTAQTITIFDLTLRTWLKEPKVSMGGGALKAPRSRLDMTL